MAESIVTKIANRPLPERLAILGAVMGLVGLVYWQLMWSSLEEDIESQKQAYTRHQKDNKDLKAREGERNKMLLEKEKLDDDLDNNQASLPVNADLPAFIENLQQQAAVAGVEMDQRKIAEEIPLPEFVKVPVDIQVNGSFHEILKYFYLLGETKRIITVEDFSLKPAKGDDDGEMLTASFRATTFRQVDGAAQAQMVTPSPSQPAETEGKPEESSSMDRLKDPGVGDKKEEDGAAKEGEKPAAEGAPGAAPAAAGDSKTEAGK